MKDCEKKIIVETIQTHLAEAEKMWDAKESHAMIVGYLTGTLKAIVEVLDETKTK